MRRTHEQSSLFPKVLTVALTIVLQAALLCANIAAQTPATAPPPTPPEARKPVKTIRTTTTTARVIVDNKPAAPQVVTILHRLNGLKVIHWLINKEQAEAIATIDENFNLAGEVHTNVIAGLALDDGQTIAAWLPEAEAELPAPVFFVPRAPLPPKASRPARPAAPSAKDAPDDVSPVADLPQLNINIQGLPALNIQGSLLEPADLRIITRDGKRILGHYIGLDGLTGLSLITLPNGSMPVTVTLKEEAITVGQRLRVIGPQPAPGSEGGAGAPMYIRIGETEAIVINVVRSPSGGLARLKVKSAKFTPANIGGIAINDNNETLGIVDGVEGAEATIVPLNLVRMAAKRVTARQASVPRPWLGIRGEPVGALSLDKILRNGWELERARALVEKRQGILLTSVTPGSPAALAKLKAGDVIVKVNNGYIRNAEEFSWLLDEANPETPVHFTVSRPENAVSEAMEIKLSESPYPLFPKRYTPRAQIGEGIEAIALRPRAARSFGSTGGLLVVSVRPATDAFKAGLRPGDVIESIDGQPVYSGASVGMFPVTPGIRSTCVVVRNKERISLTFQYSSDQDEPDKP
jgi:S1-C subfamily serine protease